MMRSRIANAERESLVDALAALRAENEALRTRLAESEESNRINAERVEHHATKWGEDLDRLCAVEDENEALRGERDRGRELLRKTRGDPTWVPWHEIDAFLAAPGAGNSAEAPGARRVTGPTGGAPASAGAAPEDSARHVDRPVSPASRQGPSGAEHGAISSAAPPPATPAGNNQGLPTCGAYDMARSLTCCVFAGHPAPRHFDATHGDWGPPPATPGAGMPYAVTAEEKRALWAKYRPPEVGTVIDTLRSPSYRLETAAEGLAMRWDMSEAALAAAQREAAGLAERVRVAEGALAAAWDIGCRMGGPLIHDLMAALATRALVPGGEPAGGKGEGTK
jgi:hypothetical protein